MGREGTAPRHGQDPETGTTSTAPVTYASDEQPTPLAGALMSLLEVTLELAAERTVDGICKRAIELGRMRLGFDRIGIWFATDEPFVVVGSFGTDERGELRDERGSRLRVEPGSLMGLLLQGPHRVVCEHDTLLLDGHANVVGRGSIAQAGMWDGRHIIGCVCTDNLITGRPITDEMCGLLGAYAATIGHLCSLVRAEERYRAFVESLPVGVYRSTADHPGRLLYANPAFARMLGYDSLDELMATPAAALYANPADRFVVTETARRDGWLRGHQVVLRRRDGTEFLASITATARSAGDSGPAWFDGAIEDISERVAAEAERARRTEAIARERDVLVRLAKHPDMAAGNVEQALPVLTETVAEALGVDRVSVWLLEEHDRILRCADLYELRTRTHTSGEVLHADRYPSYFEALGELRAIDASDARADRRTHELGESYLVPLGITSMLDAPIRLHGRLVGVVCSEHRGSQRPWEEHEIAFAADVADQVAHLLANAEQRNLELRLQRQQRLESLGVLAGGIAHDFNNILSAVFGYSELAIRSLPPESPEHGYIQQVLKAAQRARDLVRQVLTFSRQAEGERRPVLLAPIVQEAAKFLRSSLPATVEIRELVAPESGYAFADATEIHQVIMNLCTNAHHAMRDSGGVLELTLGPVQLDEHTAKQLGDIGPGRYIRLTVSDTGCGMDSATLERIFEPFFTTRPAGEGSGLGLAIVHGIVRRHRGAITVKSRPGMGTSVRIYLPAADSAGASVPREDAEVRGAGERILVVDDEPGVAEATAHMLESLGYIPTVSAGPADALAAFTAASDAYDLVLTDQIMPQMTGLRLARAIREVRPDVPTVLITGYSPEVHESSAREAGVDVVLQKPYSRSELAAAVRNALAKS